MYRSKAHRFSVFLYKMKRIFYIVFLASTKFCMYVYNVHFLYISLKTAKPHKAVKITVLPCRIINAYTFLENKIFLINRNTINTN